MASLVLTMIGDDQAGLVHSVAEVVQRHGGNWERSQLAELGGKFAGIALIEIADANVSTLTADLEALHGVIDVDVHSAQALERSASTDTIALDLLGNDQPGIVNEITGVLRDLGVNLHSFDSTTRDAPMGGGQLFEAHAVLEPNGVQLSAVTGALEAVASHLMVDFSISDPD